MLCQDLEINYYGLKKKELTTAFELLDWYTTDWETL